jgi:hypothetical protein
MSKAVGGELICVSLVGDMVEATVVTATAVTAVALTLR